MGVIVSRSWGVVLDDGEYTLISQRFPIAHKNYRCFVCGESIQTGEKYEYDVFLDGREFMTQRLHRFCAAEEVDWPAINGDSWARANGQ